jgi:hypothetical protein
VPSDATIVSGRRVADRYRLVDERSEGAWTAVDETLRRNVVVHVLPSDADPDAKEHFTAEARSLARLNHRNIICTYDTGVDGDGTSYRVDELAGGAPLDLDGVAAQQRVACALQIARAVSDAHDAGLAHGALSSSSALMDETGRVQLRGLRLPPPGTADAMQQRDVASLVDLIIGLAPPSASPLRDLAVGWRRTPPESARAMLDDIAAIPDPVVDTMPPRAPEPAVEVATTPRRGRALFIGTVLALVVAAVIVAIVVPTGENSGAFHGQAAPLSLTAKSFDPQGDKTENEALAGAALDGNPSSVWKTDNYHGDHFGRLKDGVGLVLDAGGAAEFVNMTITTPSRGWTVQVYVADAAAPALSGWGEPVSGYKMQDAATTLDLKDARGHFVLVWITDPGPSRQVRISEITVRGRGAQ